MSRTRMLSQMSAKQSTDVKFPGWIAGLERELGRWRRARPPSAPVARARRDTTDASSRAPPRRGSEPVSSPSPNAARESRRENRKSTQ